VQNRRSSLVTWAVTAWLIGCGGSALEAPQTAPRSDALSELDSLEQELEVDERRLFASLEDRRASTQSQAEGAAIPSGTMPEGAQPAPAPPSQAPAPERPSADGASEGESAAPPTRVMTSCDMACRSFLSMRRSAVRICELTSETHERCARAKERVGRARDQLSAARCDCATEN
jgi:hypothetical protein